MSTKEFVRLYIQCYPGVKNEMTMRSSADQLNGRFMRDDQVVDGALHAMAWVIFSKETPILHFPETYGRKVTVTLYDIWNNVVTVYTKPGYYPLSIEGAAAGIVLATIECQNASNEQEYQMAFDVMQDLIINDIGLGVNDYEDFLTLVPAAATLNVVDPKEVSGKEYFAIANAVNRFNPLKGSSRQLLQRTMTMSAPQLDEIKRLALIKMKI